MEDYILLKTDQDKIEKRQLLLSRTILARYLKLQKKHPTEKIQFEPLQIEKLKKLQNKIKEHKEIRLIPIERTKQEIKPTLIPPIPEIPQLPKLQPKPAQEPIKSLPPISTRPTIQDEFYLIRALTSDFSSELARGILKKQDQNYIYEVEEPQINLEVLDRVKDNLKKTLEKNPILVTNSKFIKKEIEKAFKQLRETYNLEDIYNIKYYLIKDYIGLGEIEPLLCDKNITAIYCDGVNKPLTVIYTPLNQKIETNIKFITKDEIDSLITLIAEKTRQEISEDNPTLNISLGNLRIQAILSTGILEPKFTITKQI